MKTYIKFKRNYFISYLLFYIISIYSFIGLCDNFRHPKHKKVKIPQNYKKSSKRFIRKAKKLSIIFSFIRIWIYYYNKVN